MGYLLGQSSTARPLLFLMVDWSDHLTGKTGLSPTVTLSKCGGSFASPAGAVTEVGSGWYKVAGNATDTGTLGPLLLHATASGADPCDDRFEVVAFNPDTAAAGGLPVVGTGTNNFKSDSSARVDVGAVGGTAQTARDLGAALPAAAPGAGGGLPTVDSSNRVAGVSGNVAGSVGSVTGAVGSVAAGVTLAANQHVIVDSGTLTTLTNAPPDSSGVTTLLGRISQTLLFTGQYVQVDVQATDAAERNALADAILQRDVSHVEDSAPEHSLALVVLAMSESNTVDHAGWLTVYKTDGAREFVRKELLTAEHAQSVTGIR